MCIKLEQDKIVHSMAFSVVTNDNKIMFDCIKKSLYSQTSDETSMEYWMNDKKIFPEESISNISWGCLKKSMGKTNEGTERFLCK